MSLVVERSPPLEKNFTLECIFKNLISATRSIIHSLIILRVWRAQSFLSRDWELQNWALKVMTAINRGFFSRRWIFTRQKLIYRLKALILKQKKVVTEVKRPVHWLGANIRLVSRPMKKSSTIDSRFIKKIMSFRFSEVWCWRQIKKLKEVLTLAVWLSHRNKMWLSREKTWSSRRKANLTLGHCRLF